jgi:hypothetical protein
MKRAPSKPSKPAKKSTFSNKPSDSDSGEEDGAPNSQCTRQTGVPYQAAELEVMFKMYIDHKKAIDHPKLDTEEAIKRRDVLFKEIAVATTKVNGIPRVASSVRQKIDRVRSQLKKEGIITHN